MKSEACSVNFNMSWGAVTSNPVCGLLLYDVTISPSDGVTMMRITDTSYSFAGLLNATIYTVTVAGRNAAGVGLSNMEMVTTPNLNSFLPGNFECYICVLISVIVHYSLVTVQCIFAICTIIYYITLFHTIHFKTTIKNLVNK